MDAIDAIMTRRSIRAYTEDEVGDSQLETMLRAAMAAPSAGNQQPWEFLVITDRAVLDKITTIHPYAKMAAQAPLAILICGDASQGKYPDYWPQDCAAATENLLLAAHAMGLGGVWCGIHPDAERVAAFRDLLAIPEQVTPFALVPVGVPREQKEAVDRYDSARVRENVW
jgi:nitroreductase